MRKETKELIEYAESIGYTNLGLAKSGHYRVQHRNGGQYTIAATPSDGRGAENAKADMRRIAGVAHVGPRAGNYKGRSVKVSDFRPSGAEVAASREHDRLLVLWGRLHADYEQQLAGASTPPSQVDCSRMLTLVRRRDDLEERFAAIHKPVPASDIPH
jgi:hypothetical protein